MINEKRMVQTFMDLVKIDSVSREEGAVSRMIQGLLKPLNAEIMIDNAGEKTGGNTGNLIARFKGSVDVPPLMLNAHMDTVEPGRGIDPVLADGEFSSRGNTILGADDKSAIAILLEVLNVIHENNLVCGPLEVVFTVCEEIGLLGAKYLDYDSIAATYGFALDATDTRGVVTRAPSANHLAFVIHGREAHAGAAPEKGINAIKIASQAIATLELGRIDAETTCNIGMIAGGLATNIVPNRVSVKGEVRSHDPQKLAAVTETMVSAFKAAVENCPEKDKAAGLPALETMVEQEYTRTNVPGDHPMIALAVQAAKNLGREMQCKTTGGGADANVFFQHGIVLGVLGTGMRNMHTVNESVKLADMVQAAELLLEILKLHAQDGSGCNHS